MNPEKKQEIISKLDALFNEMIIVRTNDAELKKKKVIASELSIENWDWSQGVGIYGIWRLYQITKDKKYIDYIMGWFERRFAEGLPEKNINRMCPMLTLTDIALVSGDSQHRSDIEEYAHWIDDVLLRTQENGFTHCTSDHLNEEQLWVDTIFMSGLFHVKAGLLLDNPKYIEDVTYQLLLHIKYLVDENTGLWMHGWNFIERNNYGAALWGRGNGWAAIGAVDYLEMVPFDNASTQLIRNTFIQQMNAAVKFQHANGMWSTLIDQPETYLEASGTAGLTYALLKGSRLGILDQNCKDAAWKGIDALLERIQSDGSVNDVSAGTSVGHNHQHYLDIDVKQRAYGQSLAILALGEALAQF